MTDRKTLADDIERPRAKRRFVREKWALRARMIELEDERERLLASLELLAAEALRATPPDSCSAAPLPGEEEIAADVKLADQIEKMGRERVPAYAAGAFMSGANGQRIIAALRRASTPTPPATPPASVDAGLILVRDPLRNGEMRPAHQVLSDMAAQEGCDGEPYDTMQAVADALAKASTEKREDGA